MTNKRNSTQGASKDSDSSPATKKSKEEIILEANKDTQETEWLRIEHECTEQHIERRLLLKIPDKIFNVKSKCWDHFKLYNWQKLNEQTNSVVQENMRVYCQCSDCRQYYDYKIGGSTRHMNEHMRKHGLGTIASIEKKREPTEAETNTFLYLLAMLIETAGLSLRFVENKYFGELITSFCPINFEWPSLKKIRKKVKQEAKKMEEKVKKEAQKDLPVVSITTVTHILLLLKIFCVPDLQS